MYNIRTFHKSHVHLARRAYMPTLRKREKKKNPAMKRRKGEKSFE